MENICITNMYHILGWYTILLTYGVSEWVSLSFVEICHQFNWFIWYPFALLFFFYFFILYWWSFLFTWIFSMMDDDIIYFYSIIYVFWLYYLFEDNVKVIKFYVWPVYRNFSLSNLGLNFYKKLFKFFVYLGLKNKIRDLKKMSSSIGKNLVQTVCKLERSNKKYYFAGKQN